MTRATLHDITFEEFLDSLAHDSQGCKETTSSVEEVHRKRKLYRLPWLAPRLVRGPEETQADFAHRRFFSALIRHGLRAQGQAGGTLSSEEIQEILWAYSDTAIEETHLPVVNGYEVATGAETKRAGYSEDHIGRSVKSAASMIAHDFDLDLYREFQRRARVAGSKTKWTAEDHLETRSMNVSQAARHLGLTRPTIRAMRAFFDGIDLDTGEVVGE